VNLVPERVTVGLAARSQLRANARELVVGLNDREAREVAFEAAATQLAPL
jgi:hypothetical protein